MARGICFVWGAQIRVGISCSRYFALSLPAVYKDAHIIIYNNITIHLADQWLTNQAKTPCCYSSAKENR